MGLAIVEIVEFTGTIEEAEEDTSSTYLVGINGEYRTSYGSPQYEFPSDYLLEEYKTKSYSVGNAKEWSDFYDLCNDIVENEELFSKDMPYEFVRKSVESYLSNIEKEEGTKEVEDISNVDLDNIAEDIISI